MIRVTFSRNAFILPYKPSFRNEYLGSLDKIDLKKAMS